MPILGAFFNRRTLRRLGEQRLVWGSGLLYFLGAELWGRDSPSELYDLAGVLALGALLAVQILLLRRGGSPLPARLLQALKSRALAVRDKLPKLGVDLRREPPLPRAVPPLFFFLLLSGWGLAALRWALGDSPLPWLRRVLLDASASLTFAWEALLWTLLLAGLLLCAAVALVSAWLLLRMTRLRRRADFQHLFWSGSAAYGLCVVALGLSAPATVPRIAVLAGLLLMSAGMIAPGHPSTWLLWRARRPGAAPRRMELRFWNHGCEWIAAGWLLGLSLLAEPQADPGAAAAATTLVSARLAALLAWAAAAAMPFWLCYFGRYYAAGWLANPERRCATRLHVQGVTDADVQRELRRELERCGLRCSFAPAPRRRADVALRWGAAAPAPAADAPAAWPLAVHAGSLFAARTLERIRRRDLIQRRRHLRAGLRRAFRGAAGRYQRGAGYFVAPHLWFCEGLLRDQDDPQSLELCLGPRFRELMPLAARSHFHEVLRALRVDLLFVEDGVQFKQLGTVLGILFEIYDVYGGQRAAEERFFSGIPKVRVILHDVAPEQPWGSTRYPEPDYDDVGRARVLHVFRDRGAAGDLQPGDFDRDVLPAPADPVEVG